MSTANPTIRLSTVYTVTNPVQAEFIKNLLLDHGIRCELDGDHQAGFTGALEIGILVRTEDVVRAREVLRCHRVDDSSDETVEEPNTVGIHEYSTLVGVMQSNEADNAFRLDR